MQSLPKSKIIISILCTLIALIYAMPNFTAINSKWLPGNKVNLGLDLKGGAHLLFDVDFPSYVDDVMEVIGDNLRKLLREEKVGYKNLVVKHNLLEFDLRTENDFEQVKKIIHKLDPKINIESQQRHLQLKYDEAELKQLLGKVIEQSIEIIRMRVDSTGTTEPIIQRQGDRHILLQVPGEENPQQLKNILGKTAKLTFHLVDETANFTEALKGHLPAGSILIKGDNDNTAVVIKKKAIIGGDQLTNAQASFDQNSRPVVAFSFSNFGGKIFAEVTKNNTGKRLAIVLDNRLLSAPVVNEPILGGNGSISGNFTVESANELALLLRAGALPAPLSIVEERTIGATLGADSVASGRCAAVIGFIAIAIFMIWSYGVLGIFANIALALALLYILALLSILQATLTLPGIAGIILTMGMAVDANVLIYERIKEELHNGASNLHAIRVGFKSAFATIMDSNITTLVVAFILYLFGIGAVKGFAVTLSIGIISSMFAAIIITKLLVDVWVKYYQPKSLGL
ncbi:Protein translocase subunit SecD [Candidatus Trichorickettsia mobilis]|uniref:Protein translocase subunit SecD n=1 Tax=Candidatus Trichorickettsia mobilis TaxID=1346319 RepID=A0ABZ0URX2_9RICK|nr:protein translocase subunit SecD [Candidatus Trichorickettsia mobilis]WPY00361.1 Protein translocase subunit SecD [Candidatus Trichorickettsia mobilis]